MSVNPGEVVRVDWVGDFDGTDQIVNTFQFRLDSGTALTEAEALVDFIEILEGLHALITALLSTLHVIRRIRAQNVSTGQLVGEMNFTPALVGTAAGEVSATQVAGIMNFPTLTPRVIGRKYIGPIAEDAIDADGRFTTTGQARLNNAAAFLVGAHIQTNGTWTFGFLSPKTAAFEEFNTFNSSPVPGTQRRRRLGRGV